MCLFFHVCTQTYKAHTLYLGKTLFRAVDTPGNVTPMAEFNFRADPDAADIVMNTSKGFQHSPEGYSTRLKLIEQGKQAPMHVVVLPLSSKSMHQL